MNRNGSTLRHGFARRKRHHPLYGVWCEMRRRCNDPKRHNYKYYGGRGIKVCLRWSKVEVFISDMMPTWKRGLKLERMDNDRGYSPENCIWQTQYQQNQNSRNVRWITINGITKTMTNWGKHFGLQKQTIYNRIKRGWSEQKAVTTPV